MDESGVSLVCPLPRTWAPRGHTPTIRTHIQHHQRINLVGALLVTPRGRKIKLCIQSYRKSITGDEIIRFLKHLLRRVQGPLVLVWDQHPIHQRKKVRAFLARHPRIHVFTFPTSAPELNPVEFVWTQVDEYLTGTVPRDANELRDNVFAALDRTRHSQRRLWACVFASDLPWKR